MSDTFELDDQIEVEFRKRSKHSPDHILTKGIIKTLRENKKSENNILDLVKTKYGEKALEQTLSNPELPAVDRDSILKHISSWKLKAEERKDLYRAKINEMSFAGNIEALKMLGEDPEVALRPLPGASTTPSVTVNFAPELNAALASLPPLPPLEGDTEIIDITEHPKEIDAPECQK